MNKAIADFVRQAREARDMTQEQLAEAIGKSFGYIGQLETGRVDRPKPKTLRALAAALQVPLNDLVATTDQIDVPKEDAAIKLLRLRALPTREERLAVWRDLPPEWRASLLLLMQDVYGVAAQQLEELRHQLEAPQE